MAKWKSFVVLQDVRDLKAGDVFIQYFNKPHKFYLQSSSIFDEDTPKENWNLRVININSWRVKLKDKIEWLPDQQGTRECYIYCDRLRITDKERKEPKYR